MGKLTDVPGRFLDHSSSENVPEESDDEDYIFVPSAESHNSEAVTECSCVATSARLRLVMTVQTNFICQVPVIERFQ